MESSLTKLEMDAVLQLIQLSGNSTKDFQFFWVNFPERKQEEEEESVGETVPSSSSRSVINNRDDAFMEESLPRRREKLRPIVDIYKKTQPLTKKRRHF